MSLAFEPSSRQRSLALAQALASYPTFPKDRSCMDSILIFEETIQRFEESSNTKYPDELKIATLLRCSPAKLKEHLQLTLDDKATYNQVREQIKSNCENDSTENQHIENEAATEKNSTHWKATANSKTENPRHPN